MKYAQNEKKNKFHLFAAFLLMNLQHVLGHAVTGILAFPKNL